MKASLQKLIKIRNILATNQQLKNLIHITRNLMFQFQNVPLNTFEYSQQLELLTSYMNKIIIQQLQIVMSDMMQPETIIALPIAIQKLFTLFFVIVPTGKKFDWHNHPKMLGKTKCMTGKLTISSLDSQHLLQKDNKFSYPLQKIKVQKLSAKVDNNMSNVSPTQYNIHKIQAEQLSSFLDLLMPDYPDDECLFLNTVQMKDGNLQMQKLQQGNQQIKSFDAVLKQLSQRKVRTVILKRVQKNGNNKQETI